MKNSLLDLEFVADLSLPVGDVPRAWYIDAPTYEPVRLGDWVGSVAEGCELYCGCRLRSDALWHPVDSRLATSNEVPEACGVCR